MALDLRLFALRERADRLRMGSVRAQGDDWRTLAEDAISALEWSVGPGHLDLGSKSDGSHVEALKRALKIARAAQNTYVGRHWPDQREMRRDGIGFGLNDGEHEDRIRRFLYECQPEFLVQYLEQAISDLVAEGRP
jgi:hypothetical protein